MLGKGICGLNPLKVAEREGFEPSVPLFGSTRDFQSRSFGQLGHLSSQTSFSLNRFYRFPLSVP